MKTLNFKSFLSILCLLSLLFTLSTCEKDEAIFEEDNASQNLLVETRDKDCKNKKITVCGIGETLEDAKISLRVNARISCFGTCLGQNCKDKEKNKCGLKSTKGVGKIKQSIKPAEFPEDSDSIKLTATILCKCKCVDCGGDTNVGNVFKHSSPDINIARNEALEKAKKWCTDFGCPGYDTCDEGKSCKSVKDPAGTIVKETYNPMNFMHTVTLLLEKCNCGCKDN